MIHRLKVAIHKVSSQLQSREEDFQIVSFYEFATLPPAAPFRLCPSVVAATKWYNWLLPWHLSRRARLIYAPVDLCDLSTDMYLIHIPPTQMFSQTALLGIRHLSQN